MHSDMELAIVRQRAMKKGLIVVFALSALISGHHFKEFLASMAQTTMGSMVGIRRGDFELQEQGYSVRIRIGDENFNRHDLFIWKTAVDAGLDPYLWKAVVMVESSGNERALSTQGAMGLSQLMPETAQAMGLDYEKSFDPQANLRAGASYLGWLLVRFGGNVDLALAAYNAGPRAIKDHGGIPSYSETKKYVSSVMALYRWLQRSPLTWAHMQKEVDASTSQLPAELTPITPSGSLAVLAFFPG